jgi:transcriptional regulator with XRE-family HTH domain
MILREYLNRHGLLTRAEFQARMGISRQHAWRLWHGYDRPGSKMAMRIHEHCRVPLKGLLQLETLQDRRAQQAAAQAV